MRNYVLIKDSKVYFGTTGETTTVPKGTKLVRDAELDNENEPFIVVDGEFEDKVIYFSESEVEEVLE